MKFVSKKHLWTLSSSQVPAKKFIIGMFLLCYMMTCLPLLFFLSKNYTVLDDIGLKFFPTLLDVNNQDKVLILLTSLVTFFASLALHMYAQNKFLKKLYSSIDQVQNHMSELIQGDFQQAKLTLKQEHYVYDLIKTYNYLYNSLQTNLKRDVAFLKELEEAHEPQLARVLLMEKLGQLGQSYSDFKTEAENNIKRAS